MSLNNETLLHIMTLSKIIGKVSKIIVECESPLINDLFSKPEYQKSGLIAIAKNWHDLMEKEFPNSESIETRISDYSNAILIDGILSDALFSLKYIEKVANHKMTHDLASTLLNGSEQDIPYIQILKDILDDTINQLTALHYMMKINF